MDFLVGIVVLRSIRRSKIPPLVSMPRRERRDVEQDHILDVALEDTGLDRGAQRHDLIGVHALMGLLAEELLHDLDDLRHPGHAADQDHLVDIGGGHAGILERRTAGLDGALDQILDQASPAWRG